MRRSRVMCSWAEARTPQIPGALRPRMPRGSKPAGRAQVLLEPVEQGARLRPVRPGQTALLAQPIRRLENPAAMSVGRVAAARDETDQVAFLHGAAEKHRKR